MVDQKHGADSVSVTVRDDVREAYEAAMDRVRTVYAPSPSTLIDLIDNNEWRAWDASKEVALVLDKDGLDECDILEDDALKAA